VGRGTDSSSSFVPAETLAGRFAVQAARSPAAEAVVFGPDRLTYGELDRRSNRLAHRLRQVGGVAPGSLVGVCLERSAELIVALLAVVKAGGAYLPLDPAWPAERLRWMLADSGAGTVIARGSADAFAGAATVLLDRDAEAGFGDTPLRLEGSARSLAYVMYTSGSTGLPKGVAIAQGGVVRLVVGTDYVSLGPGDRMLQASTPSFDASTFEIWGALLNGACLVGLPREVCLSPRDFAAALRREGITALFLTTALFNQVALEAPDAFRGVRDVFFGGEAADPRLVREVLARGAPGRLVNVYGPTECTALATWHEVRSVAEGAAGVPIGRPVAGTRAFVVDAELRPVSPGEPGETGELLLGGAGMAWGYANRPDATAEKFVPDPFAGPGEAGSRLYRTGDLVRRLADGALDFAGRIDQQVKIRGFRIEPGEVEAALCAHPAVRQAHVQARSDAAGEKRLVAYVVTSLSESGGTSGAELRRFLAGRLPPQLVPSAVVLLDTLPLTPNGKLDREALPDPDRESAGLERDSVAPRTPLEERLAILWRELLGVEYPGVHDDFFALGGHSLLAGRLVSRVRAELGVELALRDVYEHSTLAGVAGRIAAAGAAELPPIEPAPRGRPLPVSFPQERVWFLNELSPGNIAYNAQATIRFAGPLRPAVLAAALTEIVRRHEIFRTRFPTVDGVPMQEPLPPFPVPLPVVDLGGLPAGRVDAEAEALIRRELQGPFDLLRGPLARWLVIRHGPEDQTLVQVEHHFVHDGWSFARLLLEIRELYQAFAAGRPSPLPELPIQYADFAVWQRRWMQGEVLRRHVEHWTEILAGCPPALDLPADRPRPPVQSFRGAALRIALDPALGRRLRAFARRQGATLYTTMLAGFALLMHRLSGQDDLVVGTAAANRRQAELESMIGMVVNTLPLRFRFAGEPSFAALVDLSKAVGLDAQAWQDVPLERVVEALAPVRDPSRNPLFQVMFSFHDSPVPDLEFRGLRGELLERHNGSAKNDLNVIGIPRAEQRVGRERREDDDAITLIWEYATDLFDASTMSRMVGHYQRLLGAALDEPERRAAELPLLTAVEADQILVEWNRTVSGLPAGSCVYELVAQRARENPGAPAVAGEGGSLTYGELVRRSRRLAARLRSLGVGPEVRVGVLAERSPELVTGLLAVLEAGGAYLPIDPAYPPDRIAFVLADARAPVLLTTGAMLSRVPLGGGAEVLLLEESGGSGVVDSIPRTDPGHLAYVIYTSGSTGRPKGVEIGHRSLLNLVAWHCREYGVGPADRATLVASPGFDASVWEIWPYLAAGASLHVPSAAVRSDPAALAAWLVRERITVSFLPTPLAEAVLEEREAAELSSLRFLLTGGDVLHRGAPAAASFTLVNHYGPTENTVVATRAPATPGRLPPIGRPIANVRAYVLDSRLQPLPVGVHGELLLGGESLGRGYLGRPGLTAERFVPDPFAREPGGRLYRTGDRVRLLADGALEFLGRIDRQVKVRGFRIEPGEIEAALLDHPAVREAVVLLREDRPGERRLAAYVTVEGDDLPASELGAWLNGRLPSYMVPPAITVLAELPREAHGKVDRAALSTLPAPEEGAPAREPAAPRTVSERVERRLAELWAELLPGGLPGVHDSFFERGGHSLLAARLMARVNRELGAEVSLGLFLQAPTVSELARRVEEARGSGSAALTRRDPAAGPGPLSYPQRRLWFLDRLEPGRAVYNVPLAYRLSGPLHLSALERSLAEIQRRHEVLRTVIQIVDGEPRQAVLALPFEPLRAVDCPEGAEEAARLRREESIRPFDLSRGPLLRPLLLRLGPEEHHLLLCLHHIACDGGSAGVLAGELEALYGAFREGRPSPLAELPLQYSDFAEWQVKSLQGLDLELLLDVWTKRLAGVEERPVLPSDRPRPPVRTWRGDHLAFEPDPEIQARLEALAASRGTTLFTLLLAAFLVFLERHTGGGEGVVGTPVASRGRAELEPLIGLFANTLVLRADLGGDPGFPEALDRVRTVVLDALAHQELPFERLVEALEPERDLGRNPLFDVFFSYREGESESLRLPGLTVEPLDAGTGTAKFDLTLSVSRAAGRLRLRLEYATDLFDRATAERMAGRLRTLLAGLAEVPEAPERRLSELPVLTADERRQLIVEWNRTATPFQDTTIHGQIAAQAARTPDAVALVWRGEPWTFAELAARAGRLAGALRHLGVGPEVVVGIHLERSAEMVAAVLAVLQAGGAYLPLDPAWPAERRAFMLADSGAPVVITTRGLADGLPPGPDVLCVDDPGPAAAPLGAEDAGGGDSAYILYTSGSTGRPKGVQVTHRNAASFFAGMDEVLGTRPGTWLAVTSLSFDISVLELLWTLARGFRVVIGEADRPLAAQIAASGATHLQCTPSLARELTADPLAREALRFLRCLMLGGEILPPALAGALAGLLETGTLLNLYGPTETTVWSATHEVEPGRGWVPIGRPIANTRIYLLDRFGQPSPLGVPAELAIGGPGVSRGYLGRPELTAERFVPDPFGEPGSRLYRTGDLARWRPSGDLEFLGRLDHQVKIRGHRIEPGEVEAALAAHPAVRQAAVLPLERHGDRRLAAFVVLDAAGTGATAAELRAFAESRLPGFMVPAEVVFLAALPLTPNGKLDRRALVSSSVEPARGPGFVPPGTPLEQALAVLWSEILGVERVGMQDTFWSLGGHSLLAIRLLARVGRELGVEVALGLFLQAPTVAELARRVEEARGSGAAALTRRDPAAGPGPLSYPQRRLWFLDRLEPGRAVYNLPLAYRLSGPLDLPVLAWSLAEIQRRHEGLRTVFQIVDGEPRQAVLPLPAEPLRVVDCAGCAAEAARLRREESRRPFDLARGPLLRPFLLRLGPEEHHLLLCLHHVAFDGGSEGILAGELEALYSAFREGRPSPLAELPLQYSDFAEWQVRSLDLEPLLDVWTKRLAGVEERPVLPSDRPRPPVRTWRGDHLAFELDPEILARLEALAASRDTTLFTLLLAAFLVFLERHTGGGESVVGTPAANRSRTELEPLIGLFANTLVLRADLGGDPGFLEALDRVRTVVLDALAHQELPFERLVEALEPERDLGRNPLFDVFFSYREGESESLRLPGLAVEPLDAGTGTAKFDLTLSISRAEGRLRLRLEFATDLFDRTTVERMAGRLRTLLAGVAEAPERRLSELPVLAAEERRQLIEVWNRTAAPFQDTTIHGQIAAQAARAPDAVALVWRGEPWTFAELAARAGRLAGALRRLGVGPEVAVGIHLERSAEMVAAVLAVLQAGGAYLPLDPAWPAERRAFMLADSGASVVITARGLAGSLPSGPVLLYLDDTGSGDRPFQAEGGRGGDSAYVLYTSGSTGRPKGVQVTHRNAVSFFAGMDRVLGTEPGTWLAVTSLSFDISVLELLWTLARGFRVVIGEPDRPLAAQIVASGATHLQCTPSLAGELVSDPQAREALRLLRRLMLGGETLPPALAGALAGLLESGTLLNFYGPTETTVWSATHEVEAGRGWVPIGRPIANTRIYLLDRAGHPSPLGVPAELAIGGPGVARGYLGRPDLTAERFVPDPFGEPGSRLYRTGDLARWRPSGELEILGRLDHQVKIRGHRIEPGEIEAVLAAHPSVRQAAVLPLERHGDRRLVAFVVLHSDGTAGTAGVAAELRAFVESRLPGFMVPAEVVFLAALPLTPNGKLDRRALAVLEPSDPFGEPAYQPPRTPLEEDMAALWSEILGAERVGLQDTFWSLGGHSLLATRLLNRLDLDLGVELPLSALFQSPGLGAFTELVARAVLAASCGEGMLSEVEGLSDTEARALLAHETSGSIL
jgi:amino acid adenylation domain-containing protein